MEASGVSNGGNSAWESMSADSKSPEPSAFDTASLWRQASAHAKSAPEAPAVISVNGHVWTRARVHERAAKIAEQLQAVELVGSLRFAVTARKTVETVILALAISSVGGILCPIAPESTAHERQLLIDRLGLAAELTLSTDGRLVVERFPEASWSSDERDRHIVLIGFTSGTTGVPKGVMHGSRALNCVTRWCAENSGLRPGEAILGIMPFGSAAGFAFTIHFALTFGSPLVLLDKWEASTALELIVRHDCRWTTGVPTHLIGMIAAARSGQWTGDRLPLRSFAVGGASMHARLIAETREVLGVEALRQYGLSEVLAACSSRLRDPISRREEYDGLANPYCEVAAFDEAGHRLPAGARGEGGLRGPSQCSGYAEGLGKGEERLTPDGFFLTGDEVVVDAGGYVKVVGRFKDQIIRGGFNIDPAEIEQAITVHPDIEEVAVIGVSHDVLGEQSCAVCRLSHPLGHLTLEQLQKHLKNVGLAKRKWPEVLHTLDDFPYLPSGKIDKRALSELLQKRPASQE